MDTDSIAHIRPRRKYFWKKGRNGLEIYILFTNTALTAQAGRIIINHVYWQAVAPAVSVQPRRHFHDPKRDSAIYVRPLWE